jgi:hypothetical protein
VQHGEVVDHLNKKIRETKNKRKQGKKKKKKEERMKETIKKNNKKESTILNTAMATQCVADERTRK